MILWKHPELPKMKLGNEIRITDNRTEETDVYTITAIEDLGDKLRLVLTRQ